METVYWTVADTTIGRLGVASTASGVCKVALPNEAEGFLPWLERRFADVREGAAPNAEVVRQLREYLAGERRQFGCPLDLRGTEFQRQVWQAVRAIPYGQTRSYGDVAQAIGRPQAVRAVGAANRANPVPIIVPCHRVVGADGSLTGYGGGLALKERLLRLEGALLPLSSGG